MGAIHIQVERITLAVAVARARWIAVVRRAEPPSALRADGTPLDRLAVVECLKEDHGRFDRAWVLPPVVEVVPAGLESQRALQRNPYSHPVERHVAIDGVAGVPVDAAEAIVFLSVEWLGEAAVPHVEYALGGLRVPVASREAIRALVPPAPAPPSGGWLARLVARWRRR